MLNDFYYTYVSANRTGCPLPYADVDGKYCLRVTVQNNDFDDSALACQRTNGSFVRIDSQEKSDAVTKFLRGKLIETMSNEW